MLALHCAPQSRNSDRMQVSPMTNRHELIAHSRLGQEEMIVLVADWQLEAAALQLAEMGVKSGRNGGSGGPQAVGHAASQPMDFVFFPILPQRTNAASIQDSLEDFGPRLQPDCRPQCLGLITLVLVTAGLGYSLLHAGAELWCLLVSSPAKSRFELHNCNPRPNSVCKASNFVCLSLAFFLSFLSSLSLSRSFSLNYPLHQIRIVNQQQLSNQIASPSWRSHYTTT